MNDLTMLCGATICSSMLYNTVLNISLYKSAKNSALENLNYDELSRPAKKELRKMKHICFNSILLDLGVSIIPIYNVFQTILFDKNYNEKEEKLNMNYESIVENANEKEEITRRIYLKTLRKYKDYLVDLEPEIKDSLEDDSYRPSKKDFNKALRHLNMHKKED